MKAIQFTNKKIMNTERLKKLEKLSEKILSKIMFEETRELIEKFGLISITKIKISSDLSYLDMYVTSSKNSDLLTKSLAKNNYLVQNKYNKEINIRKLPKIRYRYDKNTEISNKVLKTIKSIKDEKII